MQSSDSLDVRRCVCANIRRTDRAITQFYEAILAPSGLHMTQFTLLATIAEAAPIPLTRLADLLVMDRTTLTRNLGPLTREGRVSIEMGEDRRTRLVTLTEAGEQVLAQALPLWRQAQTHMQQALGQSRLERLLNELSTVITLSQ
jgi:DNA-binding MarR family transcriptional regulator